jgi:hypothetical protein
MDATATGPGGVLELRFGRKPASKVFVGQPFGERQGILEIDADHRVVLSPVYILVECRSHLPFPVPNFDAPCGAPIVIVATDETLEVAVSHWIDAQPVVFVQLHVHGVVQVGVLPVTSKPSHLEASGTHPPKRNPFYLNPFILVHLLY